MLEYHQFERLFWRNEKLVHKDKIKNLKLNPLVVWSEIVSFIKGAPNSYLFPNRHLGKTEYLDYVGSHKTFLLNPEKEKIWEIAQDYEKWKTSENYFDLMDIVSYMINEILMVF